MAARENQGLQIALIIFVILTIVLIVTTFLFSSNYRDERDKGKSLLTEKENAVRASQEAQNESTQIKEMIGASDRDKVDEIRPAANKDLDAYGKGIPEGKRNYQALVAQLAAELKKANERITDVTAHEKELAEKIKTDEEAKTKEIAEYTTKLTATAKDLDTERAKFNEERERISKEKSDLVAKVDVRRQEVEKLNKETGEKISSLSGERDKLGKLLKGIRDLKDKEERSAEIPDGKVTRVNQVTRLVWINVGSEDGLRPQTTFSVYASEDSNPAEAHSKGKIEIVRLTNLHQAEARIVEDDLSNPIMPGDHVFSPIFEPGRAEHFALAGTIDFQGNGENDRQRLHDLISLQGGVIDAEVGDDNKVNGKMSFKTKFLVLGDAPQTESKLSGYSQIIGEAQTLGVKTIPVKTFLRYMGYKLEDRTVQLGIRAKGTDFKPRLPGDRQRIMPGSATPKDLRKPAATKSKSAF